MYNCAACRKAVSGRESFNDDISWEEWGISNMCQSCQDETFRDDGEED